MKKPFVLYSSILISSFVKFEWVSPLTHSHFKIQGKMSLVTSDSFKFWSFETSESFKAYELGVFSVWI